MLISAYGAMMTSSWASN